MRPIEFYGSLFLCVGTIIVLERYFPLRRPKKNYLQRLLINLSLSALLYVTVFFIVRPTSQFSLGLVENSNVGLLAMVHWPWWIEGVIGVLLLDLSFYYWHRLNHEFSLFWRFHAVHHSDPDLDATTAFRFHFIEGAYSAGFRFVQIILIGVPISVFFIYEFGFQIFTFFHHSNIKLPSALEGLLNMILVTPRMHGIHHSQQKSEANSNYSVVFSFWDRIHRTFNQRSWQNQPIVGVFGYSDPHDNDLKNLLEAPFIKQKTYWPQ